MSWALALRWCPCLLLEKRPKPTARLGFRKVIIKMALG